MSKLWDIVRPYRERLPDLWWYSLVMFCFARLGDAISLLIGIFIVPATISKENLGAILPLVQITTFAALPMTLVMMTAIKFINVFEIRGELGKVKRIAQHLILLIGVLSCVVVAVLALKWDTLERTLRFESPALTWIIAATCVVMCWIPFGNAMNQGVKNFKALIQVKVLGPLARLIVVGLLIVPFGLVGYFLGTLALQITTFAFLFYSVRKFWKKDVESTSYRKERREIFMFFVPAALSAIAFHTQATVEPSFIRASLSELDSAGYYIAAMFGTIPKYVAPAVLAFVFPMVASRHEQGRETGTIHVQAMGFCLISGLLISAFFFFVGEPLLNSRKAWLPYQSYAQFIWQIALVFTLHTTIIAHVSHDSARGWFGYLWYIVPLIALELGIFIVKPVDLNLATIIQVMIAVRIVALACALLQSFWRHRKTLSQRRVAA